MIDKNKQLVRLRNDVRSFVDNEVIPVSRTLDRDGNFPLELFRSCGKKGFLNVLLGGAAGYKSRSATEAMIIIEELSRGLASLGLLLCPQYQCCSILAKYGTDEMKNSILEPALKGNKVLAFAMSEKTGGSDAFEINTIADLVDGKWVLNGSKSWITNAGAADCYIVAARTSSGGVRRSLSLFYVDASNSGVSTMPKLEMLGLRNSIMSDVYFRNCTIPQECIIGEKDNGYKIIKETLTAGRLAVSAVATGTSQRALELAISHSSGRELYGMRLSNYQGVSFSIADMYTRNLAARSLLYDLAEMFDTGQASNKDIAALKYFSTDVCCETCRNALQIHGADGLNTSGEIERLHRDSRMLTIGEGTTETCKTIVASSLYR